MPGTKVNKEKFWSGFNKYVHELSFTNKKLLEKRERLQEIIDRWHKDRKGDHLNLNKYTEFLKIGYLSK